MAKPWQRKARELVETESVDSYAGRVDGSKEVRTAVEQPSSTPPPNSPAVIPLEDEDDEGAWPSAKADDEDRISTILWDFLYACSTPLTYYLEYIRYSTRNGCRAR